MKTIAAVVSILVILGASLGSCRILSERSGPPQPVEPPALAYVTGEESTLPVAEPSPMAAPKVIGPITVPEPKATALPTATATRTPPTPTIIPPTATRTPVPPNPTPTVELEPSVAEPLASTPTTSPLPAVPPRGVYPSPGIGSPEAVAMEEKTLGHLNWARAQENIPSYRMNPEMQALAREQALLYVQTRESTGQYPPADKISAATKARRWFFEDGGGPDPSLWLRWSYAEMESGYSLRYEPFYRNPKGSDIGIAFAFYSGKGVFGQAGGSVVVFVWNGERDG